MHTISNSFHCTEYRTRKTAEQIEKIKRTLAGEWNGSDERRKARRFARAVRARLCGSDDCACSGELGERS